MRRKAVASRIGLLFSLLVVSLTCIVRVAAAEPNPFAMTLVEGRINVAPKLAPRGYHPPAASRQPRNLNKLRPLPLRVDLSQGGSTASQIVGFSASNELGFLRWYGPGTTQHYEMQVRHPGGQARPGEIPVVWTHANTAGLKATDYRAYPMKELRRDGEVVTYQADVPIDRTYTFESAGAILGQTDPHTAKPLAWSGKPHENWVTTVYPVEFDRMNEVIVSLPNVGREGSPKSGTFEDLRGKVDRFNRRDGRYPVALARKQGFTHIRLLPFGETNSTPYSATELLVPGHKVSQQADRIYEQIQELKRQHPQPSEQVQRQIAQLTLRGKAEAFKSMGDFVKEAHRYNMKVGVDIVQNHTGADVAINDVLFYDKQGQVIDIFNPKQRAVRFEIRRNEVTQLGFGKEHEAQLVAAMKDSKQKGWPFSMQRLLPFMYAKSGDPHGASFSDDKGGEIQHGGWGEWWKHVNGDYSKGTYQRLTGAVRDHDPRTGSYGYNWHDETHDPKTGQIYPQVEKSLDAMMRESALCVVSGVDFVRWDHVPGMSGEWLKRYNQLHLINDIYRPGHQLMSIFEDYNTKARSRPYCHLQECGQQNVLIEANGLSGMREVIDSPAWSNTPRNTGNHDEGRVATRYTAPKAAARFISALGLFGGPSGSKMGDINHEKGNLEFRSFDKSWALNHESPVTNDVEAIISRSARARQLLTPLHHRGRHWLRETNGNWHPEILAMARFNDRPDPSQPLSVVAYNNNEYVGMAGKFRIADYPSDLLENQAQYMAYDYAAKNHGQPLWRDPKGRPSPRTGAEIKRDGIDVVLDGAQLQILGLRKIKAVLDKPDGTRELVREKLQRRADFHPGLPALTVEPFNIKQLPMELPPL